MNFRYIATKWNDDFVPISSIEKEEDVSTEVLVQLLLLNAFLFIDDLHGENCGQFAFSNTNFNSLRETKRITALF